MHGVWRVVRGGQFISSQTGRKNGFDVRCTVLLCLLVASMLIGGCDSKQTQSPAQGQAEAKILAGSCELGLGQNSTDDEAITKVLESEGEFVVKQQIDTLMALWAEGSSVVDAKHTATDNTDDQFWKGKDAIRHRYVRVVFPGAPTSISPKDLNIQVDGNSATVEATTQIGAEVAKGGDRWQLVKQNNCWLIQNLTYNLEPAP